MRVRYLKFLLHISDEGVHFETRICGAEEKQENDKGTQGSLSVSRNGYCPQGRDASERVTSGLVRASQDDELLDPLVIELSVIEFDIEKTTLNVFLIRLDALGAFGSFVRW